MTGLCFLPNYKITKIQKDIICFNILNCLTLLKAMLEIHQHVQEGSHLLCNWPGQAETHGLSDRPQAGLCHSWPSVSLFTMIQFYLLVHIRDKRQVFSKKSRIDPCSTARQKSVLTLCQPGGQIWSINKTNAVHTQLHALSDSSIWQERWGIFRNVCDPKYE